MTALTIQLRDQNFLNSAVSVIRVKQTNLVLLGFIVLSFGPKNFLYSDCYYSFEFEPNLSSFTSKREEETYLSEKFLWPSHNTESSLVLMLGDAISRLAYLWVQSCMLLSYAFHQILSPISLHSK